MVEKQFQVIRLPLTYEQWRQLPRNGAYKYEYISGEAWLVPRPRHYHARLSLRSFQPEEVVDTSKPFHIRPIREGDWEPLSLVHARAFERVQPFGSLPDTERHSASQAVLDRTRNGGDGPLIASASSVAVSEEGHIPGAVLITLIPQGDLTSWEGCHWQEPPPADAIENGLGQAHLTWIFVDPWLAGRGIGTMLLANAARCLLELGYEELVSTFLYGNESSMLWHWRNGFELLPYPGSWREMRKQWETEQA